MKEIFMFDQIPPDARVFVTLVDSYEDKSFKDRRKKIRKFLYSVKYQGAEFRRAIETPRNITEGEMNAPVNREEPSRFSYWCKKNDFDQWEKSWKGGKK